MVGGLTVVLFDGSKGHCFEGEVRLPEAIVHVVEPYVGAAAIAQHVSKGTCE